MFELTVKFEDEAGLAARTPSIERGCDGKTNLGRHYAKQADKLAAKHGKNMGCITAHTAAEPTSPRSSTSLKATRLYSIPLNEYFLWNNQHCNVASLKL